MASAITASSDVLRALLANEFGFFSALMAKLVLAGAPKYRIERMVRLLQTSLW